MDVFQMECSTKITVSSDGILDLQAYQNFVGKTSIFSKNTIPRNLSYLFCGLVEEISELSDELDTTLDKDGENQDNNSLDGKRKTYKIDNVTSEMGDICWYLVAMLLELDGNLVPFAKSPTTRNTSQSLFEQHQFFLQLFKCTGTIGGRIKKMIRDDSNCVTQEKKNVVLENLHSIYLKLSDDLCRHLGISIQDALQANIDKVTSRFRRNLVKGDGGDR